MIDSCANSVSRSVSSRSRDMAGLILLSQELGGDVDNFVIVWRDDG